MLGWIDSVRPLCVQSTTVNVPHTPYIRAAYPPHACCAVKVLVLEWIDHVRPTFVQHNAPCATNTRHRIIVIMHLKVLVLEWIDGVRCTDTARILAMDVPVDAFIRKGVDAQTRQLLEFGL